MAIRIDASPTSTSRPILSDTAHQELVDRIARAIPGDGEAEPLKGIHLARHSSPGTAVHSVTKPALCVIAQGSKEVFVGGRRYQYDSAHYLLTTVHLPVQSQVIEASSARPYLNIRVDLNPALVSSVMLEADPVVSRNRADLTAIDVSRFDANLLDAVVRLARLLETPADSRFLAPLITREIIFRLLQGDQGDRLRHIAILNGPTYQIARAVDRLRQHYDQPLRIDRIAREIGMSVSGFHHHFKAVTAMSPLQFQKRLRLQEARRLMFGEGLDATRAAYKVGYQDASHFNREYKSLFGLPPGRDVEQLRDRAIN